LKEKSKILGFGNLGLAQPPMMIKRRDFLEMGIAGTFAFAAASGLPGGKAASNRSPVPAPAELDELTIAALQAGLQSGKYTSHSLTEKYLDRIEEIDKRGPGINSVIEINPEATAIALALDRERKEKGPRGLLHGIPILIKDNIDTADRMLTTAGSMALVNSRPRTDAFIVARLRTAGAVLLGKTNLSEWANFRSAHSTSGWSARGGQTKNPYVLDRNPCGSSSGSGVAAAANLCAVAVGTETDGSVVCPSSANGLVGIKPTLGLISRSGIIPIAHSQDTAGPMARTVTDAALLLNALVGIDQNDPLTKTSKGKASADYTQFLNRDGLKGARIGIARNYFGFSDRIDKLMQGHIDEMKRLGAVIIDPANIRTAGQFDDSELEVLLYEFKAGLNQYLAKRDPDVKVRSLKELIAFNEKNSEREMPFFGQDLFLKAEAKGPLTSRKYLQALRRNHQLSRAQGIDLIVGKYRLDAVVAPTGGPAWPTDWLNGDHFSGGYSSASAVAGYPHITVPAGFVAGLPVGISFFGAAWSEPKLLQIAYAFEQATKVRRPPKFLMKPDFEH
jgi:amidase